MNDDSAALIPIAEPAELHRLGVFAGLFGPRARVFHVGFVVPDLDDARSTMTEILGVPVTEPMELPLGELYTPDGQRDVALRFAYSTRPVNVELIESVGGSVWDFEDPDRGHHLGLWTDDVAAESDRLTALGMPAAWWGTDLSSGRQMFSYHRTPFGFYVELVDTIAQSFYPAWFANADPAVLVPSDSTGDGR